MFLDKIEKREVNINDWKDVYSFENGYDIDLSSQHLKESTYFKCIKILSESVAKVPVNLKQSTENGEVKVKKHYLYNILRYRPNEYMSSIDFFKAIEATRQHKGEAFALITRDSKGKVTGLYPINVKKLIVDDVGLCKSTKKNKILVEYEINGVTYNELYSNVLHFKGTTFDGVKCISTKDMLGDLIGVNSASMSYQKDLFANGLTNKAVVQLTSDIKDERELVKTQAKFGRLYSAKGRIITVPAGYSITPLNLSLADSQFAELKKLNAIDLGTAFGVPSYMLGFTENYNNNSLEQSNLSFLSQTLQILLSSIELELNYKLLTDSERNNKELYFEFNVGVLLRTDSDTQANILTKYLTTGAYTPNDVRKILGMTTLDGGDDLIVNSGVLKLKDLGKGGENIG